MRSPIAGIVHRGRLLLLVAAVLAAGLTAVARHGPRTAAAAGLPYQEPSLSVPLRVADLLGRMTLAEKVGQLTQAERAPVAADPTLVRTALLGSVLSGGGSAPSPNNPTAWADMVDRFQQQALATRLQIPLLYGVDSVHGHGNLVGATIFPHNIGLGATRDPALVSEVEHVAAAETRATGPQWAFGPCLCVARDDRWGRTYESFGEDPALVTSMTTAVDGLQGAGGTGLAANDRVLAAAKHFGGDGDTEYGTSSTSNYRIDQGVTVTSRPDFERIDLAPYVSAVRDRHTGSVMPSFSSIDFTEDGTGNPTRVHASANLLTSTLKGQLGFDGFVITDWEAIHQIPGDFATKVRTAVNAGADMFMEPTGFVAFENTLTAEVTAGRVPVSRIDDAVSRILTKKFQLGLFEHPLTDRTHLAEVGSPSHRAVARRAVAESQVLLQNRDRVLPLAGTERIYLAGSNADDLGNQAGGWTVSWQGRSGSTYPGTSIRAGIAAVAPQARVTFSRTASAPTAGNDVGIVVVGETPYAEGMGDVGVNGHTLALSAADRTAIDRVCTAIPRCAVLVVAGRPQIVTDKLGAIDALVASWLPGSEGAGVADVLFGRTPFTGLLPQSWPRSEGQEPINVGDTSYDPLFPYGFGLRTGAAAAATGPGGPALAAARDRAQAAFGAGTDPAARARIGTAIAAAEHAVLTGHPDTAITLLRQATGTR
ncbi:MAG TPA: glycoside hydrolase family 3 N-terminal domain-containing protein [Mycobacteriales bacterium]|nr:glycoside hydrolase family 3 N-terminal domain-containing protein [Mycobacteriales bacterium]